MKVIRILTLCFIALFITMSTVHAQSVTVTSPRAGDSWKLGETKSIEWNLSGATSGYQRWKIVLMKGRTVLGAIADNVAGMSYSWRVGQYIGGNATPGSDYKIQVLDVSAAQINGISGVFSIAFSSIMEKISAAPKQSQMTAAPKPQLTEAPKQLPPMEKKLPVRVLFPNGGEKLEAGRSYTINWEGTSVGRSGNVNVGLFRGSTQVGPLLCTNVPNTGSCTGRIAPQIPPQSVRVKIWSAGPILFPADESDGEVMIANYRNIKILSPNGGEIWKLVNPWQPWQIRWDTGGGWEGPVAVFLYQASTPREGLPLTITLPTSTSAFSSTVPNTGTFTFIPPGSINTDQFIADFSILFQVPNGDFGVCIKVYSGNNVIHTDCSDNTFAITK